MLTQNQAEQVALKFIRQNWPELEDPKIYTTREEMFGWIFIWRSQRYLETGDLAYLFPGNSPVVVLRSGEVAMLPVTPGKARKQIEEVVRHLNAAAERARSDGHVEP